MRRPVSDLGHRVGDPGHHQLVILVTAHFLLYELVMRAETQRNEDDTRKEVDFSAFDNVDTGKALADLDVRLEHDLSKDLRQREVLEVMLKEEQPVFSAYQLQQLLDSTVSDKTVRRRLKELVELNVVKRYQFNRKNLYYVNDQRSAHAVPGDLRDVELPKQSSFWDTFLLREPGSLDWMVNSSMMMFFYLILLGAANETLGSPITVSGENEFVTAAMLVMMALLFVVLGKSVSSTAQKLSAKLRIEAF